MGETQEPLAMTVHLLANSGHGSFLQQTLDQLLDFICPEVRLFLVSERVSPVRYYDRHPPKRSRFPGMSVLLFLHESLGEERLFRVLDSLQRSPWQCYPTQDAQGRLRPYLLDNQEFYSLDNQMPVWGVRQVHCGAEILRVTLYCSFDNYEDAIRLYEMILQKEATLQKSNFCFFELYATESFALQLSLKQLPLGISVDPKESSVLQFKVQEIGQLVPLLPNPCVPISSTRWQTQDYDGNKILLQRYLKNDEFFTPGGPVFLMVEGEVAANPDLLKPNITWVNFARRLGGLCLLLEHRFYGFSRPTENLNTTNLRYLSSRQALEDVANFRRGIVEKLGLFNNKWILVGGSYGGSLAAWLRTKYPDLFVAALASSAPLKAKADFYEFLEVVQTSLAAYNSDCPKAVKNASATLEEILSYPDLHIKVAIDFNLCKLPQVDSEAEKAFFLESLALPFMEAVQFNNRFILSQGNLAKRLSVSDVCNIMTNESLGWPYERYAAVSNMVLKRDGSPCLSTSYKSYVRSLSMTSWRNIQLGSARQWTYQSCNEFGLFQTTTSNNQPFSGISLSGLLEQCSDIFGPEFNSASLAAAVEATNEAYGGLNVTGSKIIFTNGSLDPWHILGITETIKEDLPAIFIEGESHCADIYLETPQDSLQVIQAREKMFKILETWLIEATAQRN